MIVGRHLNQARTVAERRGGRSWAELAVPVVVVLTLIVLPFCILRYGYLPPDDALRHAAKAVIHKSWSEILVLRPEITMEHNPGWHWVLATLHQLTGWSPTGLVQFSVITMFVLFGVSPLFTLRRTEAWLAALAVVLWVFPYFAERAFVGRPLFVSMAVTLALLSVWTTLDVISTQAILGSGLLMAVAVWVHGSWYLLALIPAVFLLAQEWRKGQWLIAAWIGGSLVGALPTGHPIAFLHQAVLIPMLALGQKAPVQSLVGEFQPFTGGYPALIVVGAVLALFKVTSRPLPKLWRDPVFWMAAVGFALGFRVLRFWLDWGLPALALWVARQGETLLDAQGPGHPGRRLLFTCAAGALLIGAVTRDTSGRWSQSGAFEALDAHRPEDMAWLPEPSGILYSVDLSVFYETFFRNPTGDWRYALGFEPSWMTPENLAVYQELWRTLNAIQACAPWVQRMTERDRLVLRGGPRTRPGIPSLEWHYAAKNTWVGRVPRQPQ